jgi:hypothetical protein
MHKFDYADIEDNLKILCFTGSMPDTGFSMLDTLYAISGGIQNHPVSSH